MKKVLAAGVAKLFKIKCTKLQSSKKKKNIGGGGSSCCSAGQVCLMKCLVLLRFYLKRRWAAPTVEFGAWELFWCLAAEAAAAAHPHASCSLTAFWTYKQERRSPKLWSWTNVVFFFFPQTLCNFFTFFVATCCIESWPIMYVESTKGKKRARSWTNMCSIRENSAFFCTDLSGKWLQSCEKVI